MCGQVLSPSPLAHSEGHMTECHPEVSLRLFAPGVPALSAAQLINISPHLRVLLESALKRGWCGVIKAGRSSEGGGGRQGEEYVGELFFKKWWKMKEADL